MYNNNSNNDDNDNDMYKDRSGLGESVVTGLRHGSAHNNNQHNLLTTG